VGPDSGCPAVVSGEGLADALVGEGNLAIDSVGVDLEQDSDPWRRLVDHLVTYMPALLIGVGAAQVRGGLLQTPPPEFQLGLDLHPQLRILDQARRASICHYQQQSEQP